MQNQNQLTEAAISDFMLAGGQLYQLYGITDEELEALYAKGYQEYNAQKLEQAAQNFAYLVHLKPNEKRYLFALGAVFQSMKNYKQAVYYYSMAANQDISDPMISLHLVECLVGMSMNQEALELLDIMCKETMDRPDYQALHVKACTYKTLLTKKNLNE